MARKLEPSLYDQLIDLPENLVGEIINGRLHTHPRPVGPHAFTGSGLGSDLLYPFQRGRGGPGGWWIIDEPELHFIRDTEVLVPDIAGWRKERLPYIPRSHRFEVVPDWLCEVLSPSTAKMDHAEKLPVHANYGVQYLWLLDPLARTLEAMGLNHGRWTLIALHKDDDKVRVPPFDAVELALADLWVDLDGETESAN